MSQERALVHRSASELLQLLRSKQVSSRELLQEYRSKMMARPAGVTNPAWRTADTAGTLGAGA